MGNPSSGRIVLEKIRLKSMSAWPLNGSLFSTKWSSNFITKVSMYTSGSGRVISREALIGLPLSSISVNRMVVCSLPWETPTCFRTSIRALRLETYVKILEHTDGKPDNRSVTGH